MGLGHRLRCRHERSRSGPGREDAPARLRSPGLPYAGRCRHEPDAVAQEGRAGSPMVDSRLVDAAESIPRRGAQVAVEDAESARATSGAIPAVPLGTVRETHPRCRLLPADYRCGRGRAGLDSYLWRGSTEVLFDIGSTATGRVQTVWCAAVGPCRLPNTGPRRGDRRMLAERRRLCPLSSGYAIPKQLRTHGLPGPVVGRRPDLKRWRPRPRTADPRDRVARSVSVQGRTEARRPTAGGHPLRRCGTALRQADRPRNHRDSSARPTSR